MSVAAFESSFLTNPLTSTFKLKRKGFVPVNSVPVSCRHSPDDQNDSSSSRKKVENQLAKLAMVTLAAGVLTLGSVDSASAAKSGGRVGGQAFRSSAPRSSGPRTNNNSRTNIYVNPPVAPPLVGGYGYGFGVPFYGGWGWSPFSFGPSVTMVGGGLDAFVVFVVLGAVAAVIRRFLASREDDDDY